MLVVKGHIKNVPQCCSNFIDHDVFRMHNLAVIPLQSKLNNILKLLFIFIYLRSLTLYLEWSGQKERLLIGQFCLPYYCNRMSRPVKIHYFSKAKTPNVSILSIILLRKRTLVATLIHYKNFTT